MPSGSSKVSSTNAFYFGRKFEITYRISSFLKLHPRLALLPRLLSNLSCSCISTILSSTRTLPRVPQTLKSCPLYRPSQQFLRRPIRKSRRSASPTAQLPRKAARVARSASSRDFWPESTISPSTHPLPTLPGNGLAHRTPLMEEQMSVP